MTQSSTSLRSVTDFVTTRWTQVLSARGQSPEARVALGQLCEAYWVPVFRFICRAGYAEDAARDLTQEFFARLLAQDQLDPVDPGKGRFRSYLLGAVKHFLSDQLDRANALKRGGGEQPVPFERSSHNETTTSFQIIDPRTPISDAYFDRQWALNVIERALNALQAEFVAADKVKQFENLKPWLVGDVNAVSQLEAARQLGLSEGAIKVSIHRLRRRFREFVKAEIAGTLDELPDVQGELHYLVEALAHNEAPRVRERS